MATALAMAGCGQDDGARPPASGPGEVAGGVPAQPAPDAPDASMVPALEDVMERDPRYLVGISYPPAARAYPGLAVELDAYARAARAARGGAGASLGGGKPRGPYDLALDVAVLVETPRVVAVAADGSSYTGGAHGNPLVARFVWLPEHGRMLTAGELIADADGWQVLSAHVREQLQAELFERVDAWDLEPAERQQA